MTCPRNDKGYVIMLNCVSVSQNDSTVGQAPDLNTEDQGLSPNIPLWSPDYSQEWSLNTEPGESYEHCQVRPDPAKIQVSVYKNECWNIYR